MLKKLDNTIISFQYNGETRSISLKGIFIALVAFGFASIIVSAIFGIFLNGLLNLIGMIISPFAVAYLIIEFNEVIIEQLYDKICTSDTEIQDEQKGEKEN